MATRKLSERRERIATTVLAALLVHRNLDAEIDDRKSSWVEDALSIADELISQLDRSAKRSTVRDGGEYGA